MGSHKVQRGQVSRRTVLKLTGTAALAVVGAPIAAACAPAATNAPAPSAQGTPKPVRGGHLVEGQLFAHRDFNTIKSGNTNKFNGLLYVGLVAVVGDGSLTPRLAQALPTTSPDGMTYTFALRKDAKWTDGQPVTADDVVFTYRLMYHPDYKAVVSPFRGDLQAIVADVQAPDPYTVVFKTKAPRPGFLSAHGDYGVLPKHILGNVDAAALNTHEFNGAPKVTCGAFNFKEWIADDHIAVTRNDAFFLGAPNLDTYIVKFGDQSTIIQQLKTGEVDILRSNTFSRFDELASQPNLDFDAVVTGSGPRLWFNLSPAAPASRIFQSKAVRQALRYAADIVGYNNAVHFKRGGMPSSTGVFPPHFWANDPNGKPAYALDKAKAQELLEADGWTKGPSGVRAKAGLPLKFEILTSGDSQEWQQGAAILQQNWKDIGADVAIRAPRLAQQNQALLDQNFDVGMASLPYSSNVDPDPSIGFHSRYAAKGNRNFSSYKNPQADALLDQAATILDQAKRKELYFQLQAILNEDVPSFATPFGSTGWVRNKRVKGVGTEIFSGFTRNMGWFLERAYVTDGK